MMSPTLYALFVDTILIKGTLVVLLAGSICLALRHASASARHGIWAAAFAVLLLLPALNLQMTSRQWTVVGFVAPSERDASVAAPGAEAPDRADPGAPVRLPSVRVAEVAAQAATPVVTFDISTVYPWVVGVWLAGVLAFLGRQAANLVALQALRRRSHPADPALSGRVESLAREIGLRRAPDAILSAEVIVPGTFGLFRPVVVIPADTSDWSEDQLTAAVLHELGHLRRRDYLTHLLASAVRALYWVNPAIRYAAYRLDLERERACDDAVVSDRIDPVRYAEYLMRLAWRGRPRAEAALSFANRSTLPERVRSLLDRAQVRSRLGAASVAAIAAVTALALIPAATIEIVGVVQATRERALLDDEDPLVRRHAAWSLGEAEDAAAVDALVAALADPDPRVRVVAAWSLGEIKDLRALEPLRLALRDDDPGVREMAVLAIGELEHPAGREAIEEADRWVASTDARAWALRQIDRAGGSEVFVGELTGTRAGLADVAGNIARLSDEDPAVRALAAEQLGLLGSPDAVAPLLDALDDEVAAVRAAVIWALDEINPSDRPPS